MESKLINQYAVVAYVRGALAEFVDSLRSEFTPDCPHLAHITILPPRELKVAGEEALRQGRSIVSRFQPFSVDIDGVDLFELTQVVKLSVSRGGSELRTLHDILNTGAFAFPENYSYVPHITLCMGIDKERVGEFYEHAKQRWAEFGGKATVRVETLTFVQQREDETWADLAEMPVGTPQFEAARIRR